MAEARFSSIKRYLPLATLVGGFLACTLPWASLATQNLRLLATFSSDEPFVVEILKCMSDHGTIAVNRCAPYLLDWPRFYFYACLGTVYPALALFPPTTFTFTIVGRLITVLFGVLSVIATYSLAVKMFNRRVAFLAGLLMVMSTIFLQWSLTIHPDVPQMFFILMALLFTYKLAERGGWLNLIQASLFSGLAFSTKYAGALVMPAIGLACVLYLYHERRPKGLSQWLTLAWRAAVQCLVAGVTFLAMFVVFTPELLLKPSTVAGGFWNIVLQMKTKGAGGSVLRGRVDPGAWVTTLIAPDVLGLVPVLLFVGLVLFVAVRLIGKGKAPGLRRGHIVLLCWILLFVVFLISYVTYVAPFHALPVVPVVYIFVAYVLWWLLSQVRSGESTWMQRVLGAVALAVLAVLLIEKVVTAREFLVTLVKSRLEAPEVLAGRWLEETFPRETVILYDSYLYIPPYFERVMQSWGMNRQQVDEVHPDIIVVNGAFHSRYMRTRGAQAFVGQPEVYLERQNFYLGLADGQEEPYQWVRSLDPVDVYVNTRTVGAAEAINTLSADGAIYLPVTWGQQIQPFLKGRAALGFFENENSLVLPPRQRSRDALYVVPSWEEELVKAFRGNWGALMREEEVPAEGETPGLRVFRLGASDLPDAEHVGEFLAGRDFPLHPREVVNVSFEKGVRLLAYRIETKTVRPDRPFKVTLFWQANSEEQREDYTTFVHLLDERKQLQGQEDKRLMEGTYPTDRWKTGDVVIERYVMPVSACAPAGSYSLEVGFYRLTDGARLALLEPAGMALRATAALLGPFELNPTGSAPLDETCQKDESMTGASER